MFVRTNASRQNCRLGRSISRLSYLTESLSLSRSCPSSPPSSSSPSPLAPIRLLSTRQQARPWQSRTTPASPRETTPSRLQRTFATAVGDVPIIPAQTNPDLDKLYQLQHLDVSTLNNLVALAEPNRPAYLRGDRRGGFATDIEVVMLVFEACLRVGHMDRAAAVLQRMEVMPGVEPEQVMEMNSLYLEAWVRLLKADPGLGKAEGLHAWYESRVYLGRLPKSPETAAFMLKASLLTTATEGTRLTRLIRRYMDLIPPDQGLDVLYCTDILTDPDIAAITKLYPELNIANFEGDLEASEPLPNDAQAVTTVSDKSGTSDESLVPKVLETPQTGGGLHSVQTTLGVFAQMKDGHDISLLSYREKREFQARLERDCIDAALQRWRDMDENLRGMGMNTLMNSPNMNSRLWAWHKDLEAWCTREFDLIRKAEAAENKSAEDSERCIYGPVIMQSTPSRLAAVTALAVLDSLAFNGSEKGVVLARLLKSMARALEDDISAVTFEAAKKARLRKEKLERIRAKQLKAGKTPAQEGPPAQEGQTKSDSKNVPRDQQFAPRSLKRTWPVSLAFKIGAVLLSGLVKVAKVRVVREHPVTKEKVVSMQAAFTHCHQYRKGRKVGVLLTHPTLSETMRREPRADFLARHLPMVVKPDPWSQFDMGAYTESSVHLVRTKFGDLDQKLYAEAAIARGDLKQVMKGLDTLGKTAWRINRPVFDVFLEVWNTGEAFAKIPPLNPDIPVPDEPATSEGMLARATWLKALKQSQNLKQSYHSQRCFMNFQLEIARAFRDQEFFFPHNVDFRGRAYPIPTYLNHMGADHVRGLLRFSKRKELGERGLKWLKVHLANVYGFDKASLKDRAAFADENMANVIDSATNPLKGDRWWLSAEDTWQCLAACFELKAAMDLPDPTKYASSLPVHQDGTCNGLQHYAALGGDTWGAQQVNLLPGDKPADVYSAVADLVRKSAEEDVKLDNPLAKAVVDKIKRKIVKQTVMTNVYGVTFNGAKKQVLKQILAHYPNLEQEHGVMPGLVASYVAKLIFKALATMFKGAHDIQYWLGEIGGRVCRALTAEQINQIVTSGIETQASYNKKARIIEKKDDVLALCRNTIVWTTPLRMPVVQPYRKANTKLVQTCMQSITLTNSDRMDPVNRRKQLQAFPPNFIHSLDATHMLLSALECDTLGLSFAAVHDSFWTHAADVDVMNRVLRDAFIRIHSEHVIERLHLEFQTRYKGGLYLAQVDRSSEAGKAIVRWRSKNRGLDGTRAEIINEKMRLDLLNSDDPAEREQGENMETAASIFQSLAPDPEAAIVGEDLAGTTLGSLNGNISGADAEDDSVDGVVHGEDDDQSDAAEAASEDVDDDKMNDADAVAAVQRTAETMEFIDKYSNKSFMHNDKDLKPKQDIRTQFITIWLPLSFPKIPEKGDLDVRKLKDSDYFFS